MWNGTSFSNYGLTNYCRAPKMDPDSHNGPWCYVDGNPSWEHCFIPICRYKFCIDSYPGDWKGHYNGTIHTTVTGKTCKMWSNSSHPSYGPVNYCRAPNADSDSNNGPWCYINENPGWEHCFVPLCNKDCIRNRNDKNYNGTLNVTISGYHCRPWKYDLPIDGTPPHFHGETLNYCRTPHGDTQTIPWCYTISAEKRLEICNVSLCGDIRSTICPDLIGSNMLIEPSILTGHQYNSVVHFRCKNGYMIHGPSAIKCIVKSQSTIIGHWNATQPECVGIKCPSITIRHSNISNMSSTRFPGRIEVACNSGYQLNGNSSIKCNASGNWSNKPTCDATTCPDLNGSDLLIEPAILTGYRYDSEVSFKCKNGYKLKGHPAIKCTVDPQKPFKGHWNGTQPICIGIRCPPISLNNSNITSVENKRFPDNIHIKCDTGYFLNGTRSIQCTESGNWSKIPTCDAILCPDLIKSDHLLIEPSNLTGLQYDSVVTFNCENEYNLKGPKAIMCEMDSQKISLGRWNSTQPKCIAIVGSSTQSSGTGAVIGGGITAVILVVVIVIIVVIFIQRRQRESNGKEEPTHYKHTNVSKKENSEYSEISLSGLELAEEKQSSIPTVSIANKDRTYNNEPNEDDGYYDFTEGPQMSKSAILVKDFYKYVDVGRVKGGKLEAEFSKFKTGLQYPTTAALKPGNKMKNKYKNLFAYDETRVVLKTTPHLMSDYINASYINGYGQLKQYIAAQGPQDNTVNEFWQMVWQVDCCKIVMLTNVFEEAKQKCHHYWPETVGKSNDFDGIVITLKKEDVYSDFTIRHIKLQKERTKKSVVQYHFTAWPDKDVPKYPSSLVHFRHKVNSTESTSRDPVIVHCSAGIGRTGTYISLDYAVTEATKVGYVDVFRCVETLRRQRVNMVQTARQYVFLHDAVLEALVCPYTATPTKDFPDIYKDLMKFDYTMKKHKLQVEYDLLTSLSTKHDEDDFEKGKNPENKKKNRYSNIIPVESEMPRLISTVEGHNDYINAVFLPGYKCSRAFVVTQMPMENTVVDFWRLVYDYGISVVVMLNTEYEQKDVYWPKQDDGNLNLGPFEIKHEKLVRKKHYVMMELSLTSNHEQKTVTIFQQMFWNDEKTIPDNIEDLFSFITDIDEAHRRQSGVGPLLVHCVNGCDKSGLYCVMSAVIEKMRIEQDVDIQHTFKQMRNRRPQIISNYEQYRFLYEAVIEYLKQFETYANFS